MARQYIIYPSSINTGYAATDGDSGSTGSDGRVGRDSSWYYRTNMLFDVSALSGKTVTSVVLYYTVSNLRSGTRYFYIGTKTDAAATGSYAYGSNLEYSLDASATGQKTQSFGTSLPAYGVVFSKRGTATNDYWYLSTDLTASYLLVTTDEVQLAFDQQGGSGGAADFYGVPGAALPSVSVPTRTGYTFGGYCTATGGGGTQYYHASGVAQVACPAADETLYAYWIPVTYQVTFDANGGSGAPNAQTKTHGVDLTLSAAEPTRAGYNFLGWATSSAATVADYAAGGTYTDNAAVTLYAVWAVSSIIRAVDAGGTAFAQGMVYVVNADDTTMDMGVMYVVSADGTALIQTD